jgi:hypothetical protein
MGIDEYIKTSDALFHYTKTSTAIEKILYKKKFKLSLLKDSNDPREYKLKVFGTISIGELPPIDLTNKVQTIIDRILRDEFRVMCFCTNNKPTLILSDGSSIEDEHACSEGWNKSRMWSQYGQCHYGICLILSKKELEKFLEAQISDYKVEYVRYSQIDEYDWRTINIDGNRLESEGVEKYSFNHVMENSEELFFQKHIDYRDEAEFRVIVHDPDKKLEYIDISTSLKGVIVGDRTPEAYIPLIDQMCNDLNIEFRKAYWDGCKFHLLPWRST